MVPPISVVVITKNEEKNIMACLDSLGWADEVIMLDSHSTDDTVNIAYSYANVRVVDTDWLGYADTRRKGVDMARHDWILWLDADEQLSAELKNEILNLKLDEEVAIYDMPRKTFFLGEWVQHTGWYPGRVRRLFNRKRAAFNSNILHEDVERTSGTLQSLQHDILHYSYQTLYQYFDKMNAYGQVGAEELMRSGKRFSRWRLLLNPGMTFIKFYLLKAGYKDGVKGFVISVGSAYSNFIKYVNFYYLTRKTQR